MPRLTVSISGSENESRLLALPVDVCSPDGSILARGVASTSQPAHLVLTSSPGKALPDRVHVMGKLPNGTVLQQMVELDGDNPGAELQMDKLSPHEWLEWATPFRPLGHLLANEGEQMASARPIGKVWMTLWRLHDQKWDAEDVNATDLIRDDGALQFVIDVPNAPHLLQIGGEEVAWRLVSLPPGGPVRVALTRSPDGQKDSLEVTLGRVRAENELVMSYLARGEVAEAVRLAEAWNAADIMLQHKREDPVSAAAGAYLLLKNRRLERRSEWVDNLVDWFPYLADGAIVAAALALQEKDAKERDIRKKLYSAIARGLPIFTLGATVMVETMAAIHRGKTESKRFHAAYLAAQAYARACCAKGAYFAFYGRSPAEPSWVPIYGLQGAPTMHRTTDEAATETVFYERPSGARRSAQYGETRVALPRAAMSNALAEQLRARFGHAAIGQSLSRQAGMERTAAYDRLFRETEVAGIAAEETGFLAEVVIDPRIVQHAERVEHAASRAPDLIGTISTQVTSRINRTPRFWTDERLKHSMMIFDGDE